MKIDHRVVALGLVAVAGLLALGYGAGRFHAGSEQQARPSAHPPAAAAQKVASTPAGEPAEREGKVSVDRAAPFTHFRVGNRNVKSMLLEGKLLWVGTSGGVVRYDTSTDQYKLFDNRNGLLSNGIFYVGRVKGRLAVGTYGGGLSLLDEATEKWTTYNVPEGLGDAFVYDVLETRSGDLWIATWSGANRVRGGDLADRAKWELHTVENTSGGLPNDWVYGLAEGRNGEIWLATEGGLARFHDNRWDNWNHKTGQGAPYEKVKQDIAFKSDPAKASVHHQRQKEEMGLQNVDVAYNPNYIVAIEVDAQGVVWVGTWGGGLGRFDGKRWTNYTTVEGLPGNHVFMLHIDRAGKLWVGTNNGLTRMTGGKFEKAMTTADGLFANNIFAMATGADGSLWVGSFGGVAHLRPERKARPAR
jgi:ligand-binding sensor domain-containing protein